MGFWGFPPSSSSSPSCSASGSPVRGSVPAKGAAAALPLARSWPWVCPAAGRGLPSCPGWDCLDACGSFPAESPGRKELTGTKKKKVIAEQVRISLAFGFLAPEPAHVWHADLETCLMLEFHSQLIRLPLKETLLGFAEKRRGGGEATPSCGCCAGAAQRLHSCTSHLQGLQAAAGQESSKACF